MECKHEHIEVTPPQPDKGYYGWSIDCLDCGAYAGEYEERGNETPVVTKWVYDSFI